MTQFWMIILVSISLPPGMPSPSTTPSDNPQTDWTITYETLDGTWIQNPAIITDKQGNTYAALGARQSQDGEIRLIKLDTQGQVLWEIIHDDDLFMDQPGALVLFANGDVGLVSLLNDRFKIGRYRADGSAVYSKDIPISSGFVDRPPVTQLDASERWIIAGPGDDAIAYAAIDPNGTVLWSKSQASGDNSRIHEMVIDSQDRIQIAGFNLEVNFVFSFDTQGNLLWIGEESGSFEHPLGDTHIAIDSLDQVVMLATQENLMGVPNSIIHKFDLQGNTLWRHNLRETSLGGRLTTAIAIDDQDHPIAVTFGQSDITLDSTIFVTKYDEGGNQLWEISHRESGSTHTASHLALDPAGGGAVLGSFTIAAQGRELLAFRFSSLGEKIWTTQISQPGSIRTTGLHRNPLGQITVSGHGAPVATPSKVTIARFRDPCEGDFNLDQLIDQVDLLLVLPDWQSFGLGAALAPPFDRLTIHDYIHLTNQTGPCP